MLKLDSFFGTVVNMLVGTSYFYSWICRGDDFSSSIIYEEYFFGVGFVMLIDYCVYYCCFGWP